MSMPPLGAVVNAGASEEERIRGVVRNIVDHPDDRNEIVSFVKDNGGLEYAVDQLDKYVAQAVEALKVLPESKEKEMLVELAYFTARRAM